MNKFWAAFWTLNERLLSKSSWSLVVLAKILPVGVTSNQLNGDFNKALINCLWTTLEVVKINLAKNTPFKYRSAPTTIVMTE
mgnify:FL=1